MASSDQLSSKLPRREPDGNGVDRLSNLPEHLLLHILSFAPTETATATTVLSKSWQFLWTWVPDLDFDSYRRPRRSYKQNDRSFARFVTRVLLLRRERSIRRLRLKCRTPYDASDLDLWVSCAIDQNIQELDIDLYSDYNSFVFYQSCKTLVVLKLRSMRLGGIGGRFDKVSFPALKVFHLEGAKFEHDGGEINLSPAVFPVLEEMLIITHTAANFNIYLPKLRSLAITYRCSYSSLSIDCPALTHLVVSSHSSYFQPINLLSLVEADIDIAHLHYLNECESYGRSVMNLVKEISNVRVLKLSYSTMKEIKFASSFSSSFRGDDIPVFHNLVKLEGAFKGLEIMMLMLQKFENLECLTFYDQGVGNSKSNGGEVDTKQVIQQTQVPNCLTSRLTTFCFREFHNRVDHINVTRYILKNSLVLKNMTIILCSSLSSDDQRCIRVKLRMSCRGSRGVNLNFVTGKKINKSCLRS